jgi:hypothetical protein
MNALFPGICRVSVSWSGKAISVHLVVNRAFVPRHLDQKSVGSIRAHGWWLRKFQLFRTRYDEALARATHRFRMAQITVQRCTVCPE